LLLAWAWRRLSAALIDGWLYSVLSAALFVALNAHFHMAGEWGVGGVEGKGFAWVCVWMGLESLVRDRWPGALIWFGAAPAMHVIIGGWSLVAAALVWLVRTDRPPLGELLLPGMFAGVIALMGLIPALALTRGIDPEIVRQAN